MGHIAFIGAGVMGEAIIDGLIRAGRDPHNIVIAEKRAERARELSDRWGVRAAAPLDAVTDASVVVLAVKPQDMVALLDEVGSHVKPDALVISIAAGITTTLLEARLPAGVACVRVMPNTPALINQGMAAVSAGTHCSDEQADVAESMLAVVGRVVRVPEPLQDAVTALSGSGPAYVFLLAEALTAAGQEIGLPGDIARELTIQTLVGAAAMLRETGDDPALLRQRVTSPGGTTAAALRVLDERDLRGAFIDALTAARDRSIELSGA